LKLQITINGKIYEAEVEILEDLEDLEDEETPPALTYPPYEPPPVTYQPAPLAQTPAPTDGESVDEGKVCRSPVTGLVIRVSVEPGQAVLADDTMMVLEAMKMETNVAAPIAGTVKNVRVAAGDSVKVNQVIVEFE
jgi:methylmalonyl-CoA carboxyltransferase small subunit